MSSFCPLDARDDDKSPCFSNDKQTELPVLLLLNRWVYYLCQSGPPQGGASESHALELRRKRIDHLRRLMSMVFTCAGEMCPVAVYTTTKDQCRDLANLYQRMLVHERIAPFARALLIQADGLKASQVLQDLHTHFQVSKADLLALNSMVTEEELFAHMNSLVTKMNRALHPEEEKSSVSQEQESPPAKPSQTRENIAIVVLTLLAAAAAAATTYQVYSNVVHAYQTLSRELDGKLDPGMFPAYDGASLLNRPVMPQTYSVVAPASQVFRTAVDELHTKVPVVYGAVAYAEDHMRQLWHVLYEKASRYGTSERTPVTHSVTPPTYDQKIWNTFQRFGHKQQLHYAKTMKPEHVDQVKRIYDVMEKYAASMQKPYQRMWDVTRDFTDLYTNTAVEGDVMQSHVRFSADTLSRMRVSIGVCSSSSLTVQDGTVVHELAHVFNLLTRAGMFDTWQFILHIFVESADVIRKWMDSPVGKRLVDESHLGIGTLDFTGFLNDFEKSIDIPWRGVNKLYRSVQLLRLVNINLRINEVEVRSRSSEYRVKSYWANSVEFWSIATEIWLGYVGRYVVRFMSGKNYHTTVIDAQFIEHVDPNLATLLSEVYGPSRPINKGITSHFVAALPPILLSDQPFPYVESMRSIGDIYENLNPEQDDDDSGV